MEAVFTARSGVHDNQMITTRVTVDAMVDAAGQLVTLGRRSLNRGYMRAKGDLGPWVTEGTAQIHRCADENRVYLHRRTCGRVDG